MTRITSLLKRCRYSFGDVSLVKELDNFPRRIVVKSGGFTLVEVLAVIVILGIIAAIAVLSVWGLIEKAEKDVCNSSVLVIERRYKAFLELENVDRPDLYFAKFLQGYDGDVCPAGGELSYVDGSVKCSVHSEIEDDQGDEDVPFL
jgi:prepilin-type N-terminal cleavage/methylation domain-containing protein